MEVKRNVVKQIIEAFQATLTTEETPVEEAMAALLEYVESNQPFSDLSFPSPKEPFLLVEAIATGWFFRQGSANVSRRECADYLVCRYRFGKFPRPSEKDFDIPAILQPFEVKYRDCSLNVESILDNIFRVLTDIDNERKLLRKQYRRWTRSDEFSVKTIPQWFSTLADEIFLMEALKQEDASAQREFHYRMLEKAKAQAHIFNNYWTVQILFDDLSADVYEIYRWIINEKSPPCTPFHNPMKFDPTMSSLDHWLEMIIMERWVEDEERGTRRRQPGLLFELLKERRVIDYSNKVEHRECFNLIADEKENAESKPCSARYEGGKCYKCGADFDESRDKRVRDRKYFNPNAYRLKRAARKKCGECGNLLVLNKEIKGHRPQCPKDHSFPAPYAKPLDVYVYDRFRHLASSSVQSLDVPVDEYSPPLIDLIPDEDETVDEYFDEPSLSEEMAEDVGQQEVANLSRADIDISQEVNIRRLIYLLQKHDALLDGLAFALWRYVVFETSDPMNQRRLDVLWELDAKRSLSDVELVNILYWVVEQRRQLIESRQQKRRTSPFSPTDLAEQFQQGRTNIEKTLDIRLDQSSLTPRNIGKVYERIVNRLEEISYVVPKFQDLWDYACQLDDVEKLVWNYVMAEPQNQNLRDVSIVLQAPLEELLSAKQSEEVLMLLEQRLLLLYVWVQWESRGWWGKTRPQRWKTLARDFNRIQVPIQEELDIFLEGDITEDDLQEAFKKMKQLFERISKKD